MENDKNLNIASETPKPTDDAQMEIETVVPSTHQTSGLSLKSKKEENSDTETQQPEGNGEQNAVGEDDLKFDDATPTAEDTAEKELTADENKPNDAGNDNADDERNAVETITPSA